MSIVFGSNEAREVLLEDFRRRNGYIRLVSQSDAKGGQIALPAHYVAGDWRDALEADANDDDEWDDDKDDFSRNPGDW